MRAWTPVPRHPGLFSYETRKGTRYGVRRGFKNSQGKRDEFHPSGFHTWRDADRALKDFEASLASGQLNTLTGASVRLGDYFDKMAERKMKYGAWRQSTYDAFTRYFNNHIRVVFGSRPMSSIKRPEYQAFLDSLADDKKLRLGTVRTIHRVMMTTLNAAETEDVIQKNVLRRMELHGIEPKPVDINPEDFDRWMMAAEQIFDRYTYCMINVATLGLRRGEIFGLRTSSISFQKDEATGEELAAVKVDLQRGEDYPTGGPLKNKPSYRTIWTDGEMVAMLHYAILASDNLRKKNGVPDHATKWLWVNTVGRPVSSDYMHGKMKDVNLATGLSLRPHMFRHYFATRAIGSGAAQIDVMHYLGHKNLQMTADYTRPTKVASLDVFKGFDHATGGTKKCTAESTAEPMASDDSR
ncbi:tyrosine-type recombinase/integrase [Lacticaseibacillus parakribbianus]|uniref:tyrosine-type recombinase/integrase n=1 Tax=Lacticaseibacillus parakribbianus TaxID=2970927 RepID=UPI0021CB99F9|nr:site-specific integrase [Lacticaseibacillus parakribbianus]